MRCGVPGSSCGMLLYSVYSTLMLVELLRPDEYCIYSLNFVLQMRCLFAGGADTGKSLCGFQES